MNDDDDDDALDGIECTAAELNRLRQVEVAIRQLHESVDALRAELKKGNQG